MSNNAEKLFEGFDDLFKDIEQPKEDMSNEKSVTATPVQGGNNNIVSIDPTGVDALATSAQQKLTLIEQEMNNILVERDDAIHCLMLAIISGQSMLMLGAPGAARIDIVA